MKGGTVAACRGIEAKSRQSLIWSRRPRCWCTLGPGAGWGLLLLLEANYQRNLFLLSLIRSCCRWWPDVLCFCCCCWVWGGGVDVLGRWWGSFSFRLGFQFWLCFTIWSIGVRILGVLGLGWVFFGESIWVGYLVNKNLIILI